MNPNFWLETEPEELFRLVATEENLRFVLKIMKALTPDPVWTPLIVEAVEAGRLETRCFISWFARELQPKTYLEVGVRRGFSMAMTAARSPQARLYGFDLWVADYAGVPNPGPEFVASELRKVGYNKKIYFFGGDSHQTLPAFFSGKSPAGAGRQTKLWNLVRSAIRKKHPGNFDLIVIDGDHTLLGAYQDLLDAMPHCSIGGAVIFDDILPGAFCDDENGPDPHGWGNLLGVWRAVQKEFPNFVYFEYLAEMPGVGLAIRME
jgi:predicted O-methyltransferase YrrM